MENSNDITGGLIILIIALVGYFLPWLIALSNHRRQTVAIFVLNLFLGWTLLGWIIALIWAFIKDKE